MKFTNLTPHDVTVYLLGYGRTKVFPRSGKVARVSQQFERFGTVCSEGSDIPLFTTKLGKVIDLPEREEGNYFIVSAMVKQAEPYRLDLVSPGELLRDDKGQVVGCNGFVL